MNFKGRVLSAVLLFVGSLGWAAAPPEALEPQCSRAKPSPRDGVSFMLPDASKISSLTFRENRIMRADLNRFVEPKEVAGRRVTVLCEETISGHRIYQSVVAVRVEGIPSAQYADLASFSSLLWQENDRSVHDAGVDQLKAYVGKPLWSRQLNTIYLDESAERLRGVVAVGNLDRVELAGVAVGTSSVGQKRALVLSFRLPDGRVGFQHFEASGPTVQLNARWRTADPVTANPDISPAEWQKIRAGHYELGMREKVVRLMLGVPDAVNRTRMEGLDLEQHVYRSPGVSGTRYLYFANGLLHAIQD